MVSWVFLFINHNVLILNLNFRTPCCRRASTPVHARR
jgi:hypothetical protein